MNAEDVKPRKWMKDENYPIRVLYDDGEYSVIWGKYDNKPALGVRWNESENSESGYPYGRGGPEWYVEPNFIAIVILNRILCISLDNKEYHFLDNIQFAINELSAIMRKE